ncbi:Na+/H+ antiporter subunit D [Paenibacillus harenae]|uniref:Na+/H+ antiporter subunit D n=1 Tax=Paenibacillus harenae TaxID=306543 RepID=UPI00278E7BBF|nr:Na+/H+ antiporter subunit D [Paenibacillus harenae]MDQ0061549.1 multicomponent Na+:H+ antiporter subunit D [Paenibacillus harenae]
MNNLLVMPLLIPLCTAVLLLFLKRNIVLQRSLSLIGLLLHAATSFMIVYQVHNEGIQTLHMGGWAPPYGIVFVADSLASLLVAATSIAGFFCLIYSFQSIGEERERFYYYPLFQFLLVGVSGSFLTGDLFNLFVCFEVMLISSYALIVLGGTKRQLRETLKYMLINILSSTLFVATVAYLYGVTGTLNMAHLSIRIAEMQQGGILNAIAVLLMIVFAMKAGLFLFFWLPGSYSAPPAAVAALFGALLTKVGVYALIRSFTLLFYHEPSISQGLIGWMAGATIVLGSIGAIAFSDVRRILNYNVIISVGFIAYGLSAATRAGWDGAVFYLIHDMTAKALLFILGGIIVQLAGTSNLKEMGGMIRRYPLVGWMFFVVSLAVAGIPPLSGFAGKLLILQGGLEAKQYVLAALSLLSSIVVLCSLLRIFIAAFWGEEKPCPEGAGERSIVARSAVAAAGGLLVLIVAMGLGSEWVYGLVEQAGHTLYTPSQYIESVLKEQ